MICLTFDTDFMSDADMARFLAEFPLPGRGTFFLWRPFQQVTWQAHEIQPHPFILPGEKWEDQVDRFAATLGFVPRGVRTHSCVYSQPLGCHLAKQGYRYTSMTTPLFQAGLHPYRHPWGLWELPVYYMDNMDYCLPDNWPDLDHRPFRSEIIERAVSEPDLYLFDFHPLHVVLNTSSLADYHAVRHQIVNEGRSAFDFARGGNGTRTFYEQLCRRMEQANLDSVGCLEAINEHAARDTGNYFLQIDQPAGGSHRGSPHRGVKSPVTVEDSALGKK